MEDSFQAAHAFSQSWGWESLDAHMQQSLHEVQEQTLCQAQHIAATTDGCNAISAWDAGLGLMLSFPHEQSLEQEEAENTCIEHVFKDMLHRNIWQALRCGDLPAPIGFMLYDSALHLGCEAAMGLLQQACNTVGEAHLDIFTPIQGHDFAPEAVVKMAKDLQEHGLDFYTARLCLRQRVRHYTKLSQKNKKYASQLWGWKQRCQALLEYMALMEREC